MRNYTTALLQASIEHESGLGHQFKSDSRRYKAFVQAIDELSAQLLIKKSGFEADVFKKLAEVRDDLQIEIDAIEDEYNSKY